MRTATLLLTCPLLLTACGHESDGIALGDTWIPGEAIDTAVREMKGSFPQWGENSLAWHVLDGGFGPAWLLHAELAAESSAALEEADRWARRLQGGESFADLARERTLDPEAGVIEGPFAPSPFEIRSGRVAAAVGSLEPGQWTGPVKTIRGWELIWLQERGDAPRNRASVTLIRLEFPVGAPEARERARVAWNTLPIGGSPDRIRDLPFRFRHGRVAAAESS
ncbi:MAG: peptidylprolyl isomerase [Planctomycetes bacterium]|nr:peptidylprolyl isomerase [Planctomycetota bacterium]MBL7008187.1 peptidylprolyl isomerase [Planctomycetota bacterium]